MNRREVKRAPTLRFKGFTNDWEQRKLGEIAKVIGGGTPSTKNSDYWNGNINWYSPTEIGKSNYIFTSKKKITKLGLENSSAKILPGKHTILFTSRAGIGNMAIMQTDGCTNQGFQSWVIDNNTNIYFLYSLGSDLKKEAIRKASGSTFLEISNKEVKKIPLSIPSKHEQDKLGKLFLVLDNLLSLQQRKVNDLNSMKSALLQDVFPNTQGIKKIKLSTQEWNLQKISSIFKERNQRNKNGMLLSVSISKGVYPFSENDRKDNSSNDKSNYKEVKINDLAYNSMRMWQGAVGVSKYNGIVSPAYTVITPKKEENPNFYYYYFKNKRMLFNFRQHSQGLTSDTWNLKFPLFEKILIQVPSDKEEEKRISSLFKQIDKSIELSKIQIKKLTSIKQFLLQNMFI